MPKAARVGDTHICPLHGTGVIQLPCSVNTKTNILPQARLGDTLLCAGGILDVIMSGAATTLVNGLPAARVGDKTVHGGTIGPIASLNVGINGPTFTLPANFVINGDANFQQKVVRDLYFLSKLPSGKELLRRLEEAGKTITFEPFSGPNSYCAADNPLFARAGIPTSSTIQYNPQLNVQVYDRAGNLITMPPQLILGHEMTHGLHNSEGTQRYGVDPKPPSSEPTIPEEESYTIGTGSHNGEVPSENSMRNDLGLPERDNHLGVFPPPGSPPPPNLRPGGP